MKAVIKINNRQYLVEKGQELVVNRMDTAETATFSEVMMVISDDKVEVGTPYVPSMTVSAQKVADLKGDKIRVFKYKAKSRYRKTKGFRPKFTKFKIIDIGQIKSPDKSTEAAPKKVRKTRKSSSEKKS